MVKIAEKAGYKAYMIASKKKAGSNVEKLKLAEKTEEIIGLNRLSFTKDYPDILKNRIFYYLNCKLKIESYTGNSKAEKLLQASKKIRNLFRKKRIH